MTIEHYIRRNEHVNPLTAELLDQALARADDEQVGSPMSDPIRTVESGSP